MRAELAHLLGELDDRLVVLDRLARAGDGGANLTAVGPEVAHYRRRLAELAREASDASAPALAGLAEVTRAMFGLVAGVEGAVEWHSPARACSGPGGVGLVAAVGAQDYRRDRCTVVGAYERAWLDACVDRAPGRPDLRALAFASGMAALTTVLAWLAAEPADHVDPHGSVLLPVTTYHETRMLLARGPLAGRLRWVASSGTDEVLEAVDRLRPSVVLLDVQANGPSLEIAEVDRLLAGLAARTASGRRITVVVDTTMLGVRAQPFALPPTDHPGIRLLTVESLTKFAQLGLDRVAAGIVVADDGVVDVLDDWREHLGTNATSAAVRQLPRPSRAWLEDRWSRHQANAAAMAHGLHAALRSTAVSVVHPGLAGHPSHAVADRLGTAGAAVALTGAGPDELERVVDRAVPAARRSGLALAEGTSFGFDTTRISLIRPAGLAPFVRLSPGAGPVEDAACLASIVAEAVVATLAEPPAAAPAGRSGARLDVVAGVMAGGAGRGAERRPRA